MSLLILVSVVLVSVPIIISSTVRDTPQAWLGLGLLTISQLVLAGAVWWRRQSTALSLLVAASFAFALFLAAPSTVTGSTGSWWPSLSAIATTAFVGVTTRARWGWLLATAVIGTNAGFRLEYGVPSADGSRIDLVAVETAQLIAVTIAAVIGTRILYAAARATDEAVRLERVTHAEFTRSRDQSLRAREVDRFVHDEILHTLRTLAMDASVVNPTNAIMAARGLSLTLSSREADWTELDPMDDRGLLMRLRETANEVAGIRTHVTGPRGLVVPNQVAQAFQAAVREALRNVERHAGVDLATVAISHKGLAVTVTVDDHGRGFDTASTGGASDRRGVADSILKRMNDVGGHAQIGSALGRGTKVSLGWEPAVAGLDRSGTITSGVAPRFAPALALIAAPPLVANLWHPLWLSRYTDWPSLVTAASVLLVVTGLALTLRGQRGRIPAWAAWGAVAIGWTVSLVGGLALTPDTTSVSYYWLSVGAAYLAVPLALFRSNHAALVLGAGLVGVSTATTLQVSPTLDTWFGFLPAITAPVVVTAIAVLIRQLGDRFAWEVVRAEADAVADSAALLADTEFRQHLHERLQDRRAALTAFLNGVVARGPEGLDERVRSAAARLERAVREDLVVDGQRGLGDRVEELRGEGWRVTVRCGEGLPEEAQAEMVRALHHLAPSTALPAGLTVNAVPKVSGWRLSLLATGPVAPASSGAWQALGWEVSVIDDEVHAVRLSALHDEVERSAVHAMA